MGSSKDYRVHPIGDYYQSIRNLVDFQYHHNSSDLAIIVAIPVEWEFTLKKYMGLGGWWVEGGHLLGQLEWESPCLIYGTTYFLCVEC